MFRIGDSNLMTNIRRFLPALLALLSLVVYQQVFRSEEESEPSMQTPRNWHTPAPLVLSSLKLQGDESSLETSSGEPPNPVTRVAAEPVVHADPLMRWAAAYLEAPKEQRDSLVQEGLELARERGGRVKQMIQDDPEQALREVFSPSVRAQLPEEIADEIEEVVHGTGFYGVMVLCNHSDAERATPGHAGWQHEFRREVELNGEFYQAHIYGKRDATRSAHDVPLVGVALDNQLALAEGRSLVVEFEDEVLAFAGEERVSFPEEEEAVVWVEERLAALDDLAAGEVFDPVTPPTGEDPPWDITYDRYFGPNSHQKGVKTMMIIYANGADYLTTGHDVAPYRKSDTQIRSQAEDVSRTFYDWSYRQTWFGNKTWSGTPGPGGEDYIPMVHAPPTVVLPNDASYYGSNTFGTTRSHLISAVRALGGEYASGGRLDPSNFDRITFYMRGTSFGNGLAYVGSNFMWASHGISNGVAVHELGHNWGVFHANSWNATTSQTGVARHPDNDHGEYGGAGDIMGGSGPFSVMFKQKLGFLEKANAQGLTEVQDVTTSGTYRLFDHTDVDSRNPTSALRGLFIPITGFSSTSKHLILGFRHYSEGGGGQNFYRDWGYNSVEVLSDGTSSNSSQNDGSHYLDTSPFSYQSDDRPQGVGDDKDGAIPLGRTYSEPANLNGSQLYGGFHITPVARGQATDDAGTPGDPSDDTTHEWIDVKVMYNAEIASNEAPVITTLTVSNPTPAVGEAVTLNVSATDSDGDPLYYWWKFHQVGASQDNQSQQTLSWDSAGEYYVTAHVSDGKGGLAIKGIRVTVGSSTRYDIRGRVLRGGLPVAGAKLWISSPSPAEEGDMFHDAFSESDGTYTFTNLPPGSYTIRAVHPVFLESINPGSHSVNISSSSQFGRDFDIQVASANSYSVTGRVLYETTGNMNSRTVPLPEVEVQAGGSTTVTDADGYFTLNNVPTGDHSLSFSHPLYRFDPGSVSVSSGNVNSGTHYPLTYRKWMTSTNTSISGFHVVLEGYPGWLGMGSSAWDYVTVPASDNTVEPTLDFPFHLHGMALGYSFTPSNFTNPQVIYQSFGSSLSFSPSSDATPPAVIEGYVRTTQGKPVVGVTLTGGGDTAETDSTGYYQLFTDGSSSVTVTPVWGGYSFTPASDTLTVNDPVERVDFVLDTSGSGGDEGLPTVATAATASVQGPGSAVIDLQVLGADDNGESNLTYTWSKATGTGYVIFGANGSHGAKTTTVEAKAAGNYSFTCTITDSLGNEVTSTTSEVTVTSQLAAIIVSPGYAQIGLGTTSSFTAQGFDQFGDPVSVSPVWSVSAGGSINPSDGSFEATTLGAGFVATATQGSVSGTGLFDVIPAPPVIQIVSEGIGFTNAPYVFEADATDPDGTVSKVEFYIEGSKVGEDFTEPFSYTISSPVIGQYTLYAVAIDNEGNTTGSLEKELYIVDPLPGVFRFNIEPETYSPTPSGYLKLDQTVRSDFHDGLHYGWYTRNTNGSKYKEWNAGSGNSGSFPDEVHDTYVEMDRYAGFRVRVPNGVYSVRMGMTSLTTGNLRVKVDVNGDRLLDENWDRSANAVFDRTIEDVTVTNNWIQLSNPQYNQLWSFIEIVPDGPVMSVAASGDASEVGPQATDFTLTREANFTDAFTLNFSLNGTSDSADYTVTGVTSWNPVTQTGTLDYTGSDTTKVITVTPVQDSDVEGTETVQFKIEDGTGYASSTSIAEVDLFDAQTNYPPTANLVWPVSGQTVSLDVNGSHWVEVSGMDDGFGGSSLSFNWSSISGPGTVTFHDDTAAGTSVTVDTAGEYTLRATVSDGNLSDTVDVTLQVGNATPTNGQIVHWDLNEGSGTSVTDQSGNGHDGTSGAGWSADGGGVSGGAGDTAAVFSNNSSHQISDTNVAALSSLGGFTVSLWVNPDAAGTDRGLFSSRPLAEWNGVSDEWPGISMRYDAAGWFTDVLLGGGQPPNVIQSIITFPLGGSGSIQLYAETSANTQVANQWQHIVLTWTRGDRPRYYINGVEDAGTVYGTREGTDNSTALQNNVVDQDLVDATAFVLGRGAKDTSGSWDGRMDEFRFYNRALTAAEVSALYNGSPVNTVPVVSATADSTVDVNTALPLDGSVSDAESTPTSTWRKLSGPGAASFGDASAEDTSVTFDTAGTYEIALVANDGDMADGEVLTITVGGGMVDNNGNDVPDSWEATHEDPGQPGTVQLTDGNNYAIRDVYFWGVDSTSGDPLKATQAQPASGGGFQFTFYGVAGVNYRVKCSTDLANPSAWTTLTGYENVVGTGANVTVTDATPGEACSYRVEVIEP